jgi:hypothetical protein
MVWLLMSLTWRALDRGVQNYNTKAVTKQNYNKLPAPLRMGSSQEVQGNLKDVCLTNIVSKKNGGPVGQPGNTTW